MEDSNSSYWSRWFCVLKKDGKSLRIVHNLQPTRSAYRTPLCPLSQKPSPSHLLVMHAMDSWTYWFLSTNENWTRDQGT